MSQVTMDRRDQDCYFYYYSTCTKGEQCVFRHEPAALGCETICPYWLKKTCANVHCSLRHMQLRKNRKLIPCFWENQPNGCRKPHCPFLHTKPKVSLKIAESEPEESEQQVNTSQAPLDRGDWSRGGCEGQRERVQATSDGDVAGAGGGGGPEASATPERPVPDPLTVSFDDGMRLY